MNEAHEEGGPEVPVLEELPATMTVEEAARLCGISRRHAYELAARGELPVVRFGKALRVPTHRLMRMLDGETGETGEEAIAR